MLPRPGRRAALPRGRPARRLRPLLELQGRAGAGDRRVPRLARARIPSPASRAGNVIGGGDDAPGRLLPDLIRAGQRGEPIEIRAPRRAAARGSTCSTRSRATCCWPSGSPATRRSPPRSTSGPTRQTRTRRLDRRAHSARAGRAASTSATAEHPPRHEAAIPRVDSTRARTRLGWAPPWDLATAIDMTVEWHLAERDGRDPRVSLEQIERHGAMATSGEATVGADRAARRGPLGLRPRRGARRARAHRRGRDRALRAHAAAASRRRRRTSRARRWSSAPRSRSRSTRSTSAPAGSRRCASRPACRASAPSRPGCAPAGRGRRRSWPRSRRAEVAATFGQDPAHELMALFARALRELGDRVTVEYFGRFLGLVNSAEGSAERLAETLAALADLARRLALRRRARCRSTSAPRSPPPTSHLAGIAPAERPRPPDAVRRQPRPARAAARRRARVRRAARRPHRRRASCSSTTRPRRSRSAPARCTPSSCWSRRRPDLNADGRRQRAVEPRRRCRATRRGRATARAPPRTRPSARPCRCGRPRAGPCRSGSRSRRRCWSPTRSRSGS